MDRHSRSSRDTVPAKLSRAYAVIVFLGMSLLTWLFSGREGVLQIHQMLVAGDPSLEGFLTHQLFHTSGIHLFLNMLAILIAGGILESYWGTPKFLVFCFFVAGGVALISLGLGRTALESRMFGGESPVSYGASGVALGCLVCMAVAFPQGYICRGVAIRHVVWALIFAGAAGLITLDRLAAASGDEPMRGSFLVTQVSGVGVALFYIWAEPRVRLYWRNLMIKRQVRQKAKIQEIRKRVDQLLDKINQQGYDSLSVSEKSFLKQASKHYKQEK